LQAELSAQAIGKVKTRLSEASFLRLTLALALFGCSSGESTQPGIQARTPVTIVVTFSMPAGGSVTATMDGKTYNESPQVVVVPAGVVEISGTFSGTSLGVSFGRFDDFAGVVENSLQSVVGPGPVTAKCGATFTRSGTGSSSFRIHFTVSTGSSGHC